MSKFKRILFSERKDISKMSYKEINNEYVELVHELHNFYGILLITLGTALALCTMGLWIIH